MASESKIQASSSLPLNHERLSGSRKQSLLQWTGVRDKTLWDWLQLLGGLALPIIVAVGLVWLTMLQSHSLQVTADQQQEVLFQNYLDRMSDLLFTNKLNTSTPDSEAATIAHVRTMAVLRQLDADHKGMLLNFLYNAGLLTLPTPILDLSSADLSQANLREAILYKASFSFANFSGATLNDADLSNCHMEGANLGGADLQGATLSGASLNGSNLRQANLKGANLSGADLSSDPALGLGATDLTGADLSGSNLRQANVTTAQLAQAKSLKGAILPDGSTHP